MLTKLEQSGIRDAHPLVVHFQSKVVNGRQCDETLTKVERVWLNGSVHWRLWDDLCHGLLPYKSTDVLPVVQDPRTVARLALGRARTLNPTRAHSCEVEVQLHVNASGLRSVPWSTRIGYQSLMVATEVLDTELEIVRVLRELALVRMVPVDRRA